MTYVLNEGLVGHLESRLGRIAYGWSTDPAGEDVPFQVARFEREDKQGPLSFATIGLSQCSLTSRTSGRRLRLELLLCMDEQHGERNVPLLLQEIGLHLIESETALLRGDSFQSSSLLIDGTQMKGFYVTMPVYFDDAFASCLLDEGREAAIVWLVPVHGSELEFIRQSGWEAFERLLEQEDPNLYDVHRPALETAI